MVCPPSATTHLCSLLAALWEPREPESAAVIPWPDVIRLAQAEDVAPLLHVAVQRASLPIPEEVRDTLEYAFYQTVAADTLRTQDLRPLLAALSSTGTPTLLLKGPALGRMLYQDTAIRPMGDIDLAVPLESVAACHTILASLGYTPVETEIAPGSQLAYRNEQGFLHKEPLHPAVELHWHLLDIPYYLRNVPISL